MSKKPETKPVSEIDKKVEEHRKEIERQAEVEREQREYKAKMQSAIDKAYQVLVDHKLNTDEATEVVNFLHRRVTKVKTTAVPLPAEVNVYHWCVGFG